VAFVRALVADQVILRYGFFIARSYERPRTPAPIARIWRRLTPWVREAVWSRYL
jgi:hypothetical protein